ncbi:MAG: tetratricopeptide repeat protein [Symploca sp. SIO2C1]|nr:tetratricopeptide repeat protein [Symploca sp. SIO2C1]
MANEDSYEELLVSIEAAADKLNLLLAVCDDSNYREQLIKRYEEELESGIRCYQVMLARGEPSLRAAIAQLVAAEEYLRQGGKAVVTVTGAEKLYFLKLGQERSEQEIFFGYLQWTREALREFPFSIVLWVTHQIEINLSKQAPDFLSWCKGVFRFRSFKSTLVSSSDVAPFRVAGLEREFLVTEEEDNPYFLPLADLQELIEQTEKERGVKEPNLATLYARMGEIYYRRLRQGKCQDYQQEQALAIEYFRKAVNLQQKLGLEEDLATDLNNLAGLYKSQGRYDEAEPLYEQALEIDKRSLPKDHPSLATHLNNLANLYESQGRYDEAEPLYEQALEIDKRSLPKDHPSLATDLNNLAGLYKSQGRYDEAEPLYEQALEIDKRSLPKDHPSLATDLNNLAQLYKCQGRYAEAEPLYEQALEIDKRSLPKDHPSLATHLNNLANLYESQGRYNEAELLYEQALEIDKHSLPKDHPSLATHLNNLAGLYESQGRYDEAEPLYLEALRICDRSLGSEHPNTVTVRKNFTSFTKSRQSYNIPWYKRFWQWLRRI